MAKILVVDDSLFARMRICDMLRTGGHETLEAEDGVEGLAQAERTRPDLIVTDLLMPELDGIGLLAALRAAGNATPAIVLSADIQESKRRQCLALGAAGFLAKPPQQDALLDLVAETLRSAG